MKAIYSVVVGGQDITAALNPILIDISVSDKAGTSSDNASITLDDRGGQIIMPKTGDDLLIKLGWEGNGVGTIFSGKVSGVRSSGSRGGLTLSISGQGFDPRARARQQQRRHFDDATIKGALDAAGKFVGITVSVDPAFASIKRPYISLDDESFLAFGERLAGELGGTFKINGDRAILAKRNGGANPIGEMLPVVTGAWGLNLHSFDIEPARGRMTTAKTLSRYFDSDAAEWKSKTADTGTEGASATAYSFFSEPDNSRATEQSRSNAAEYDRLAGGGTATIEGNLEAQPEGLCVLVGCRPGIDGTYRIDSVDHSYSRSGWTTTLQLKQPKGDAGKDGR